MACTDLELYRAMCDYARKYSSPRLYEKLKAFRESHGLLLEPMGYTDFNQALIAIEQRELNHG